MVFALNP